MKIANVVWMVFWLLVSSGLSAEQKLTALVDKPVAPAFNLPDTDGKLHTLQEYRGKPVIVNFWATWCPPCRDELPSMNRAWTQLKSQGVAMVAINVGEDEDTIFEFTGSYPIDFTVLMDKSGEIISQWPVQGLPTTFVLNPEGRIIYRAIGGREWDDKDLLDIVRSLR